MSSGSRASNLSTIKSSNRNLILRLLNSMGGISRAELSRTTGLTKTSITNIINELIEEGIIYETGPQDSSSGRKPILLHLRHNACYALGVLIGRDYVYSNIVNLNGDVLSESEIHLEPTENEKSLISLIYSVITDVLTSSGIDTAKVLGIGVASIGPLDIENGIILDPPNFRGLKSIPIVRLIKDKFAMRTFLDNDINACAIAEKLFGNAKHAANYIFVGVGRGIGAGIFLDNTIFRGNNGFAGEIGHITIDINGSKCPCGNSGCLELYASTPNIVNQVKSSISLGAESTLSASQNINWTDIVSAARKGDPLCIKVIDRMAYYLSVGLVNAVNLCDPEVLYLGNEISLAGDLILNQMNDLVNGNFLFRASKHVRIELSKFKDKAPHMGAPSIVLYKFFNGEL